MKTTKIEVKCGIYNTAYVIRDYGNHIVVSAPYVRWINNSGSLDFRKTKITHPESMSVVRALANAGELVSEDCGTTLQGLIDGCYSHYPIAAAK